MSLPNELWLHVFEDLPLGDLLAAYSVCHLWRSLVPNTSPSLRHTLFALAIKDIEERSEVIHTVSHAHRLSYVTEIETTYIVSIPEPYRIILIEWPSKRPPPGFHWPEAVRFHATGECWCRFEGTLGEECRCTITRVNEHEALFITRSLLETIHKNEPFDFHDPASDARWELFSNPPRLHTDTQNERTLHFIRTHPPDMWEACENGWTKLPLQCLSLSNYRSMGGGQINGVGTFYMILQGPARGEIHAWGGWYDGIEAKSFLDWKYEEWSEDPDDDVGEEER